MTNKTTKKALVLSLFSLLLCFSMLLGTTFAWFTDSVTSANNIIKSGNLDIEFEYWNGTEWVDVAGKSDILTNELWEPGVAEVAYLRVKNAGSLALKYQLGINIVSEIAGVNAAGESFKLSDYIMFGVVEGVNGETGAYANRDAAVAAVTDPAIISTGYTKASDMESGDELYFALVVYMPTTVGNDANHDGVNIPQIDLGFNVIATQLTAESDSFGPDYDKDAWVDGWKVNNAQDLQAAINNGVTNIVLEKDIELDEPIVIPALANTTYSMRSTPAATVINLNGKTITGNHHKNVGAVIKNEGNLVLKNGTISSAANNGGSAIQNNGTLIVENATLNGAPNADGSWPSYTVNNTGDMTATNVKITSYHGAVASYGEGALVTLNNCEIDMSGILGFTSHGIYTYNSGAVTVNGGVYANKATDQNSTGASVINGAVTVNGGTFSGRIENYYGTPVIKGGTFSVKPNAKFVAGGFKAVENNGKYAVVPENVGNVIFTADDLMALSGTKISGSYALVADIDLGGAEFKAMSAWYAAATFNGNGYTISNVKLVSGDNDNGTEQSSLFFVSTNGSLTVSDLTIKDVTVTTKNIDNGYAAAVVGYCEGALVLNNVDVVNADITGSKSSGMLVGHLTPAGSLTATDCDVDGSITISSYEASGHYAGEYVGTIAGNTALIDCTADVTLGGNLKNTNVGTIYGRKVSGVLTVDGAIPVATTEALIDAIKNAPVGEVTTIALTGSTYAGDINITLEAMGKQGGDVVIKAAKGVNPVITGTVTLGYRKQGTGATMYNANVTFEGITFDHVATAIHSLNVQDVKSLTLKDCTVIGDGEYGIGCASGNATGASKIIGCTFENTGMQLLGNYATGLVIDDCTFNNSRINVQAGNGVTVQNCEFNGTLTDANVGDSFYMIRSNSTPITVKDCTINVDSTVTGVAAAQAKWYLLANRGTTNWTVTNVVVTLTPAALLQTELDITACTSTGAINATNLTVNGVQQ